MGRRRTIERNVTMRQTINSILTSVALLLATTACGDLADSGQTVATPTADRGAILIEAIAEDFLDDQVAVIDVSIRSARQTELAVGRVVWPNAQHRLVTISTRCDPADNPFSADARLVGLYDGDPGTVGAFGDPPPAGSVVLDGPLDQQVEITCIAGESFHYRFVFSVPSSQPAVAINASVEAGAVGDALWSVVARAGEPPAALWEDRITSAFWGDGMGGFAYPAPCSTHDDVGSHEMALTIELHGLYADPLPLVGNVGDPVPDGALDAWLPPPLTHQVVCEEATSALAGFDVTIARVDRESGTRATFAGVVCRAGWECEDEATATLDFACRAEGDEAPVLYLDDVVLHCGENTTSSDPSGGEVTEDVLGGVAWTSWRVPVDLTAATGAGCILSARGTAATRDRATVETPDGFFPAPIPGAWMENGAIPAGAVYPLVSWSIPAGGASAPSCEDASLDLDGVITMTYTDPGDAETRFEHDSL